MGDAVSEAIGKFVEAILQSGQVALNASIITAIASAIISIFAYFVKRRFALIDFQNQQDIEQSSWLLKRLHKYARTHYPALTRSLYNAELSFSPSRLSIADDSTIEKAYEDTSKLIKEYWKFRTETGGMVLLLNKEKQNEALGEIQSLLLSLPFDDKDQSDIQCNQENRTKESFMRWIKDNKCPKSIALVRKRLYQLRSLFDNQTNNILQHESFLESRKKNNKKIKNIFNRTNKEDEFYILSVNQKYVKNGDIIRIIGSGFPSKDEKERKYNLFLMVKKLQIPQ